MIVCGWPVTTKAFSILENLKHERNWLAFSGSVEHGSLRSLNALNLRRTWLKRSLHNFRRRCHCGRRLASILARSDLFQRYQLTGPISVNDVVEYRDSEKLAGLG